MRLNGKRGKELVERCSEENPHALQFSDMNGEPMYQPAIVGIATRCGQKSLLVYDRILCIQWLVLKGRTQEDAESYFDFNTAGSWNGKNTPIILER